MPPTFSHPQHSLPHRPSATTPYRTGGRGNDNVNDRLANSPRQPQPPLYSAQTTSVGSGSSTAATAVAGGGAGSSSTTMSTQSISRNRQYTHLHAQLAQLNAHMADMENLVGMTAVQAGNIRGLGAWWGGAYMSASKILGEETANRAGAASGAAAAAVAATERTEK